MQITDKDWEKFQERIAKADRKENNRQYRGRTQLDPDSPVGYHSKSIQKEHPTGERHHLSTLARMHPVFRTVQTKEQLGQLSTALRNAGVTTGDSWEQLIELPRELHDSSNAESIHRVEQELGLDDPYRYVPENATFKDALAAVPLIAKDQQESRKRVQDLQYRQQTVGDSIGGKFDGFTDAVLNPRDKEATASNNKFLKRQLNQGKRLLPRPFAHQVFSAARKNNFANRLMGGTMRPVDVVDAATNVPGVAQAKALVQATNPDLNIEDDFNRSVQEVSSFGKNIFNKARNQVQYMGNRLMQGKLPYMP